MSKSLTYAFCVDNKKNEKRRKMLLLSQIKKAA